MEAPHNQTVASSAQTPLILDTHQQEELNDDTLLNHSLRRLETFLRIFGFCQYSVLSFTLSWVLFLLLGVALPLLAIELPRCSDCERYQIKSFELEILVSQSLVAAISLLCISRNLRKYGLRKFLFVDRYHGHRAQFREEYLQKINGFFRLLAVWLLPCFLLRTAREVIHTVYLGNDSWWQSVATFFALLVPWTYSAIIYLSGSALFNLVINLQVIHFENYGKLLERDLDVSVYIEEHTRLNHHLSKISHRFRIFLLLEFLFVTASLFVSLIETTENRGIINFTNGGNFAVCCIVELLGLIILLHSAAKISHRAQSLASVTSRWHALVTCNSNDASQRGMSNNGGGLEAAFPAGPLPINYSESDLDSIDYVPVPTNTQLASCMSSYHKRQAFVLYMQCNLGGATIFGWTVDRALINTIFFVELSLVLFVLGKTISFTTTT
ncbi:uncharacterized protein LOC133876436 [Alnus glutinosa]|uniref:uncharacterized protein LOC133876436 n=1 Tax=Alnus glutinosa TaxID=3517 RepID=UPI002D774702|nr:uncharacterized protein LOC133876436 [Alnus glutinosa]